MIKSPHKKALPSYFLLIVLPAIFGLIIYCLILQIEYKHRIEDVKSQISKRATDFMAKTTAVDYFKPYFQNFSNKIIPIIEEPQNFDGYFKKNIEVTELIEDIRNKLGENIRCAIFDEKAELLNSNDLLDYEIRFFSLAWKKIHEIQVASYKKYEEDKIFIIGREFNTELMIGRPEACIPVSSLGRTGVFFFHNGSKIYNGIILFVDYKRSSIELAEAKIKDFSTVEQPIILYNSDNKKPKTPTFGYKEVLSFNIEDEKFLDGFVYEDMFWKRFKTDEYNLLFGQNLNFKKEYYIKILVALCVFIFLLIVSTNFFFKNIANNDGMFISIRYKLVFLFSLAIYMPTLSLFLLSYTSLKDYRIAIENRVKKGMLDVLNKIDMNYKEYEDGLRDCYLKIDSYFNSFKKGNIPSKEEIRKKLEEIVGTGDDFEEKINWINVRDIRQNMIYTTSGKESMDRLEKMAKIFALIALEKHSSKELNDIGYKPSQSELIMSSIMENPIIGFSALFERPKELISLNFEGVGIYYWWNCFHSADNPIAFYICNASTNLMNVSYFNSLRKNRYSIDNTSLKLINFIYENQTFIPEKPNNQKDLLDLINVSNMNKRVETTFIKNEDKDYICLCLPGNIIKECFLLCMFPVSSIDYQIDKLQSDIYLLMIILLVVSILTSSLLAKNFIVPVNELNRGLKALSKRDTQARITITNKDELGKLGDTFNQMMGDIKDMLLAGAVQQCLIPTGEYPIDGYECIVYNQMAEDVGGDYADIFELPDDRILVVIGDVTGHGIASSLLTAMVKASIFRFASKNTSLSEIVTNTSDMICDLLSQKKLMTFCAITLDKKTGELFVCNAGHPYPIIKKGNIGSCRFVKQTTLPMGLSKKRCRYTSLTEKLDFGESLLLYTDGFPEAENIDGEEFGYDNFKDFIANANINSVEDLKNLLVEKLLQHHGEKALSDDITFIILRRKPLQNN